MTEDAGAPAATRPPGPLAPEVRWLSIGMCALVFLAAFEQLAVTTSMPLVARELGGESLYALAFAGPLAIGVVGTVVAGNWCDRAAVRAPLLVGVGLFVAGLLIAGLAVTMPMLVVGRLVHGIGGGAITVPLYVLVARAYAPAVRPRILAGFAAAWVVPALIGPAIAGIVADTIGWRWVFLGVILLVLPALAVVLPALRGRDAGPEAASAPWNARAIAWSAVAAVTVLALTLSAELPRPASFVVGGLAFAAVLAAIRPLLPAGVLTARRGMPSVVLLRLLIGGAFVGTEVYLPYLLTGHYRLDAAVAGIALTGSGLAWSAASWLQGRAGERLSNEAAFRIGTASLALAIVCSLATTVFAWPAWVAIVGWIFAGSGMGLMFPRTMVAVLADADPAAQGFVSSAVQVVDAVGPALALALTAAITAVVGHGGTTSIVLGFCLTLGIMLAAGALAWSGRTRPASH
ncbi:MFS transporter [Agromyces archimandritae]|nr:MFS transporter [Agromyces archimandritae]